MFSFHNFSAFDVQGGEPDVSTVSKMVLNDWQRGKIPFFVKPPNCEKVLKVIACLFVCLFICLSDLVWKHCSVSVRALDS